jgi:hypothetical protein
MNQPDVPEPDGYKVRNIEECRRPERFRGLNYIAEQEEIQDKNGDKQERSDK